MDFPWFGVVFENGDLKLNNNASQNVLFTDHLNIQLMSGWSIMFVLIVLVLYSYIYIYNVKVLCFALTHERSSKYLCVEAPIVWPYALLNSLCSLPGNTVCWFILQSPRGALVGSCCGVFSLEFPPVAS